MSVDVGSSGQPCRVEANVPALRQPTRWDAALGSAAADSCPPHTPPVQPAASGGAWRVHQRGLAPRQGLCLHLHPAGARCFGVGPCRSFLGAHCCGVGPCWPVSSAVHVSCSCCPATARADSCRLHLHRHPSWQVYAHEDGGSPGPVTAQQRRSLALAAQEAANAAAEELDEVWRAFWLLCALCVVQRDVCATVVDVVR